MEMTEVRRKRGMMPKRNVLIAFNSYRLSTSSLEELTVRLLPVVSVDCNCWMVEFYLLNCYLPEAQVILLLQIFLRVSTRGAKCAVDPTSTVKQYIVMDAIFYTYLLHPWRSNPKQNSSLNVKNAVTWATAKAKITEHSTFTPKRIFSYILNDGFRTLNIFQILST